MGIVYSLYDALVSVKVPDEKAKAVIDALEREMMDKLATKADIEHLQASTNTGFAHLREIGSRDMASLKKELTLEMKAGFSENRHVMTVRMAQFAAASVVFIAGLVAIIDRFVD